MRRTSPLVVLAMLCAGLMLATPADAFADKDCGDFDNQAQAQKYLTSGDPHGLDRDGDGKACDSLPCPCSSTRPQSTSKPKAKPIVQYGRVTRVVDGDTVKVRLRSGVAKTVRLLGIDTPETHPRVQCYGRMATRWAKKLLPVGTQVKLVSDTSQARTDRYGRILRYVSKGRTDVNGRLLYVGAARVYVYNKPFQRVRGYRSAQVSAKAHNRGLWKSCR